jgi:uncharacterized protein
LAETACIAAAEGEEPDQGPTRRCIATGAVKPVEELIRFVVGPESQIVPDIARRLPGRGLWLTARRDIVSQAVQKRLFARAAKAPASVEAGLEDRVEALLARRCAEVLGLARRAGLVKVGFVKVRAALLKGDVAIRVEARDGAEDGRAKLGALAQGLVMVSCLDAAELGAALGRDQAVHIALSQGPLSDLFLAEARRLSGFRAGARVDVSER